MEIISGGEIACKYGSAYASLIGNGRGEIVEDTREKIHGLNILMQNQTGRKFPIIAQMAKSVAVIKIVIEEFRTKAVK